MSTPEAPAKKPSVRMTPDEVWKFVEDGHTGIFTTLRRDGVPIAMPIWYVCLDRAIYIGTRGKKLVRIKNDPRASFLVEDGEYWAKLRAVHLTGRCEIVDLDPEMSRRYSAEMDRKYAKYRTSRSAMPSETRAVYQTALHGIVKFTPDERVLNWDNTKLGLG
ncbi:MAG: pyridoxamine 5'-phosphate oxidase family protein [Gammaproteobacteria bacterium]